MKSLIIDDERKARNLLRTILTEFCPEVVEIYEAEDLPSGVLSINKYNPDIVFLDVEMPEYAGTQILDFFDKTQINFQINFQIVFTTAYNEYAMKAFELNAISYLLKPLRAKHVKEAVAKVMAISTSKQINTQLQELNNILKNKSFDKIGLPISDGILFVKLEEIFYIQADGMYSKVFTETNGSKTISKPLKYFENLLKSKEEFFRVHRSFLINMNHIKQITRKDGGYILMENDALVSASKKKITETIELLEVKLT